MINQFDSANYPDVEPRSLTVGSYWAWKRPDITEAYPTATYSLEYRFSLQVVTETLFTITAGETGSEYVIEVGGITTGAYTAGEYYWQAVAIRTSDSEEMIVDSGYMTLTDDLGNYPGDTRSWVQTVLQSIRAVIASSATKEQSGYTVFGRSLERRSLSELIELERDFAQRFRNEQDALDRENGRAVKTTRVYMKMGA